MEIGHRHDWKRRVYIDLRKKFLVSMVIVSHLAPLTALVLILFAFKSGKQDWFWPLLGYGALIMVVFFFTMAFVKCPKCEKRFFKVKAWVFGFVLMNHCKNCGLKLFTPKVPGAQSGGDGGA